MGKLRIQTDGEAGLRSEIGVNRRLLAATQLTTENVELILHILLRQRAGRNAGSDAGEGHYTPICIKVVNMD